LDIQAIINSLSPEEKVLFQADLRLKNKRKDVKNITLYKLLLKNEPFHKLDKTLYGKPSRNAFHGLSKRLQDNLIDFIAVYNFETETSQEFATLKLLLTARVLYERDQSKVAFKIINKAQAKAQKHELFSILGEIYHTQIQYAHLHPEVVLDDLIKAFNHNQELHRQQENLNLATAYIKQQLQQASLLDNSNNLDILQHTFEKFKISINTSLSIKSFYQILDLINSTAHLEHNFTEALPYIQRIYGQLQTKTNINKHRFYHIQILYYLANAYFRNKAFDQSEQFLKQMEEQLLAEKEKYNMRFRESYLLIKSLNLNYTGKATEAIFLLEQHFETTSGSKAENPDLLLCLITYYAQQENYRLAWKSITMFRHTDTWYRKKMGIDWVIKKELIGMIIHLELEHISLVESLINRFKRAHKMLLKQDQQIARFFELLQRIYFKPEIVKTNTFKEQLKTHFADTTGRSSDVFMISYFAWLKAKNENRALYPMTLELIQNKS